MEQTQKQFEPLLKNRFLVKFFDFDGLPHKIESQWVRNIKLDHCCDEWNATVQITPPVMLEPGDIKAISAIKVFFLDAAQQPVGSYFLKVQEAWWSVYMDYTPSYGSAVVANPTEELLTYKIEFKA